MYPVRVASRSMIQSSSNRRQGCAFSFFRDFSFRHSIIIKEGPSTAYLKKHAIDTIRSLLFSRMTSSSRFLQRRARVLDYASGLMIQPQPYP
jgi:hypothetical protein